MPSFASGNRFCTACASTWAQECRMTLRPSSVSAATGVTSTSKSGTHDRSRSRPSASRTTTMASEAPRLGSPASRTAAPAVVPAGTRIRAAGAGLATALIGRSPHRGHKAFWTRPCYPCGYSGPQTDGALQPGPLDAEQTGRPGQRAEQPQRGDHDDRRQNESDGLHPPALGLEPLDHPVVSLACPRERVSGPFELGGENGQADEDDRPTWSRVRDGEDADAEHGQPDDADDDAVGEVGGRTVAQLVAPAGPRPLPLGHGWPGLSITKSASASQSTVSPSSSRPSTKILRPSMRSMPASTRSSLSIGTIWR